ncbi:hypothetical protein MB02_14210 [Croceicoccus estronivorus]|nr:hypothetical protein MB02_14210 [Croceicoccus estronivorus]
MGPFDSQTLPSALTREHRLKAGAWGILRVQSGSVVFVWDDQEGGTCALAAGDAIIVPPQVPHHLDIQGDFRLEIEFLRLP